MTMLTFDEVSALLADLSDETALVAHLLAPPAVKFNPNHDPHTGEFVSGDGGAGGFDARIGVPKLGALSEPVFAGTPVAQGSSLTTYEKGQIGENVVLAYLRQQEGHTDAVHANEMHKNFPVDLMYDHTAVEVKAGTIDNRQGDSQYWRLKIGQPGKNETAALREMDPAEKAALNRGKQAAILDRKAQAIADFEKAVGHPIVARTMTVVLNHDQRTAAVYSFDGFHKNIGWNSPLAKGGYVGSFSYAQGGD